MEFLGYCWNPFKFSCSFLFSFGHVACGILVPRPGIEPRPSAVRAQSPNHWTTREFPLVALFVLSIYVCGNVQSNYFVLKWIEIVSVCVVMPQLKVQMYFILFFWYGGFIFKLNFVLYLCEIFIWASCLPFLLPYLITQLRSDWTGTSEESCQVWRYPNSNQGSYKIIGPAGQCPGSGVLSKEGDQVGQRQSRVGRLVT